jgi:hypothetical protein
MEQTMSWITPALAATLVAFVAPATLAGQDQDMSGMDMSAMEMGQDAMTGDSLIIGAHMTMTPGWPEATGDRARADSSVALARAALARYADVAVAEQDGFRKPPARFRQPRVYHYTRPWNAIKARWSFDPTAPTSLLYRPEPDGSLRLIGAMYTAPASASLEELNRRLPLSIAQWHQHTNLCLPPRTGRLHPAGDTSLGGDQRFGFRGITTAAACQAAGGVFHARAFGWMVHVNMFDPDGDLWEHHH